MKRGKVTHCYCNNMLSFRNRGHNHTALFSSEPNGSLLLFYCETGLTTPSVL